MKLAAFVLGGGATFVLAAALAASVYWFAPIVPCRVEAEAQHYGAGFVGYGTSRDDFCTGQRAHGYATGASANRSARLLQSGLFVGCLFAGLLGAAGATKIVARTRRSTATARSRPQ